MLISQGNIIEVLDVVDNNKPNFNGQVLLDISEPTMFTIYNFEDVYTGYVMQNRYIKTKDKKRAHVKELLLAKTNYDDLISLLQAKLTIYEFFEKSNEKYQIAQIANKVFPKVQVTDLVKFSNKIPEPEVKLCHNELPNKIDTYKVLSKVLDRKSRFKNLELTVLPEIKAASRDLEYYFYKEENEFDEVHYFNNVLKRSIYE